jgi:hypothetical protein
MEPEDSLLCSQKPATGPYPEPEESSSHSHAIFFKIHSNIFVTKLWPGNLKGRDHSEDLGVDGRLYWNGS